MSENAAVVFGEASESDDDTKEESFNINTISEDIEVGKEVTEVSITSSDKKTGKTAYHNYDSPLANKYANSIKKLQQRNKTLYENLLNFKTQLLSDANHDLNIINQQLLKSQIELQESLRCVKASNGSLKHYHTKLNDIITAQYLPRINIL